MHFSLIYCGIAALTIFTPIFAQDGGFSDCIHGCNENRRPIFGCLGGSEEEEYTYCDCWPDLDGPDARAAACLMDCAEQFDYDYTEIFHESCDMIFEGISAQESSSAVEGSSTSQSAGPTASETEEPSASASTSASETGESGAEETPDAAAGRGLSALILAGGLAAAIL